MTTRRTSLPGAAELFRTTSVSPDQSEHESTSATPRSRSAMVDHAVADQSLGDLDGFDEPARRTPMSVVPASPNGASSGAGTPVTAARAVRTTGVRSTRRVRAEADRAPSGRERHDEKITVYCSPEELLDLESARLQLRAQHGLAVDRGRIVREALAVVLADLEAKGEASILVRRLRQA
jgi:hypothetical protein